MAARSYVGGGGSCDPSRPKFLFKIKTSEGKLSSRPMFKPYEAIPTKKVARRPSSWFKLGYVENSVDQDRKGFDMESET